MAESIRVLHIEDDPTLLKIVSKFLEKISCEVDSHPSFDKEKINWLDYNLLILDFMLPDITGMDIGAKARREGFKGPILILSSKALSSEEHNLLNDIDAEFMTKPFGPQIFINRIQEILSDSE